MARTNTKRRPQAPKKGRNAKITRKQIEQDAVGFLPGVGAVQTIGKYLGQRQVDRFVQGNPKGYVLGMTSQFMVNGRMRTIAKGVPVNVTQTSGKRVFVKGDWDGPFSGWIDKAYLDYSRSNPQQRNPEDIELLNDLAPEVSIGHIAFTPEGLEEFVRDGFVYHAYSNTPVFGDGYRMGTPIETLEEVARENPAKYERCVKAVQKRGGANAYAVCTAAGTRNPKRRNPARSRQLPANANYSARQHDAYDAWVEAKYALADMEQRHSDENDLIRNQGGVPNYAAQDRERHMLMARYDAAESDLQRVFPTSSTGDIFENPRRRRRNPASEADALYETFHGAPPSETLAITEQFHVHGHLAGLGDLVMIQIRLMGGTKDGALATINAPDPQDAPSDQIVHVASNEDRNQMFLVGGDQDIDLKSLGFRESFTVTHDGEDFDATDIKDHMILGEIQRLDYMTEKAFDKFETISYFHKIGEDTKVRPFLVYEPLSKHMSIYGGEYTIHAVGIVN